MLLNEGLYGLVADCALGWIACSLLLRHSVDICRSARQALHLLHVDVLREELSWLNYFPAGFKLNVPLTLSLGSGTLFWMEWYAFLVGRFAVTEGAVVEAIAKCAAIGGLALGFAVCHDLLRLLALHTSLAHRFFAAVHNVHSSLLGSLWQLFRGRKNNVLRSRVDSCTYDAAQLLLGTLVFTVLFFLTPTIAVFYSFFCMIQAVSVGFEVTLVVLFVLANELPAYRILLAFFAPGRCLSGIKLQVLDNPVMGGHSPAVGDHGGHGAGDAHEKEASFPPGVEAMDIVYFRLHRCRAPSSTLLEPYSEIVKLALRNFPLSSLAKSLVLGRPLPGVRYQDFVTARAGICFDEGDRGSRG